ncbi:hypothetical protein ACGF3K_33980 [Streptomyces sp. NPDC047980]|uniref:hypothetical protein n=1 Tax=Streptomyces sp. NPDC047980 TaxID=3365494 RepID=UPI003720A7AB
MTDGLTFLGRPVGCVPYEVATLLNLEVDLLFFDTTSTCFEREDADEPVARDDKGRLPTDDRPPAEENGEPADQAGFPTFGRSKDSATTCRRS